jgi:SAM-dependent methyltransferase
MMPLHHAVEELPEQIRARIEASFLETYLADAPADWLASSEGRVEIQREIAQKYDLCRRFVLPWVERVSGSLDGAYLVEIGCGTGSKLAAFAQRVGRAEACDISPMHAEAARRRLAAMGIANALVRTLPTLAFLEDLELAGARPDVVLLYAVLEHLRLDERLETLSRAWKLLPKGGRLVVGETPNRLLPLDRHSSQLPFFNMLPDELALRYYRRSPRRDYVEAIDHAEDKGLALVRQGRGVSYHEFELALETDLSGLRAQLVGDVWDVEMLRFERVEDEERSLQAYAASNHLAMPPAFSRSWIKLVMTKGGVNPRADPQFLEVREHPSIERDSTFAEIDVPWHSSEVILGFRPPRTAVTVTAMLNGERRGEFELDPPGAFDHWHSERYVRLVSIRQGGRLLLRSARGEPPELHYAHAR